MRQEIRDPHVHRQRQEDLVDHLWMRKKMLNPLNIFRILKNLTEKKLRTFEDLEAKKMKKLEIFFELNSGAFCMKCATSNRIFFEKYLKIFFVFFLKNSK